ncbi:MAG: zf-HC2 domain-containing protein [Bryobacteraceae bacterium]
MTCFGAKRHITAYLDGRLDAIKHAQVSAHVQSCESCSAHFEQMGAVKSALSNVPRLLAPARLRTQLRVLASREQQLIELNGGSHWLAMWSQWKFRMHQMMRPLTIPATGGLISSLILFGTLAFTISTTTRVVSYEVPLAYQDEGEANQLPFELRSAKVILNMSFDSSGRLQDYAFADGTAVDSGHLQYLNVMMPQFPAVLALAHPTSGDIRISFTPLAFRQ